MKKLLIAFIFLTYQIPSFAETEIVISKGSLDPMPIAINDLGSTGSQTQPIAENITQVIIADLERSGLFRPIDKEAFIEKLDSPLIRPNFISWRNINATAVLAGNITMDFSNKIKATYRLWDPYLQKEIGGGVINVSKEDWRRLAHRIADDIYLKLTGEKGYFDTKVLYVSEVGKATARIKRLGLMDYDGKNLQTLTDGQHLVLTPRFSPDNRKIMYLSYAHKIPSVHLMDLDSGRDRSIGNFQGMSFAPRFSPDGTEAVMSVTKGAASHIYSINLSTMEKTQLTSSPFIDTSPFYSPDGKYITFSSDRSGRAQIYIMNRDGSNQKRITFENGTYNTPVWSPKGDYIAFTRQSGEFYIGIIRPDGSGERMLDSNRMVEGPTWSPNGRVIMYASQARTVSGRLSKSIIKTIDISGHFQREIVLPTGASDPEWGGFRN